MIDFSHILLEPEQQNLFRELVQTARSIPRDKRAKFFLIETMDGTWLQHPTAGKDIDVFEGDLEALTDARLLRVTYGSDGISMFDITPLGFKYYEFLVQKTSEPFQRVENEVRRLLDASDFQQKHSEAYKAWCEAERRLWRSDSVSDFTAIGHTCREAMQHFATSLVERKGPSEVDPNPTHTVARVKAVVNRSLQNKGTTQREFLEALLQYWVTAVNLTQRQEHGAQKEGEELVWEDARRVVFQTALVMFEIDRVLVR